MAWTGDRWIGREERAELIRELRETLEPVMEFLNNGGELDSLPADVRNQVSEAADELERLERIHRAEVDLLYFAYEYFGDVYNPGNPGNWIPVTIDQAPEFHRELGEIMDEVSTTKRNAKICWAAPRSHAKSSYLSKAFPLREICYRNRKFIILISETPSVAISNMEWLALQLKFNEKLRKDFGPLLSPKQQENPRDNNTEFVAWEPRGNGYQHLVAKVLSTSANSAIRGTNWLGNRPDLIIMDDLESKKNTNTPELRQETRNWFTQSVMPLGDPEHKKTAFVYMGTVLHPDSLLQYVLNERSDFRSRRYQAVIEWPERMDLWEECRKIYQNRENENAAADAEAFYLAHKEEMDRGAKVLWPAVQPLFMLMRWKWDNGSKAFNTEYQNNPIDEESQLFKLDELTYWDEDEPDKLFPRSRYDIYMGIDFAMGKERGDYSAIAVVARHKKSGTRYVLEAWGERVHPDRFIKEIVRKVLKWEPDGIAAEAQAAQEFFVDTLKEELRANGYPSYSRVTKIKHRSRKELRIEAMIPDIEAAKLQFSRKHALLLEQMEQFPNANNDDLIDAVQMADSIAKQGKRQVRKKPKWL
jgi:predicted phage terminase large subunit-like protein